MPGVCPEPGCPHLQPCPLHHHDRRRPSATARGYGRRWLAFKRGFIRRHPICVDCGAPATVPDHDPESRKQLLARGVSNPDQDRYCRPRCASCHSRRTVEEDGGFGR